MKNLIDRYGLIFLDENHEKVEIKEENQDQLMEIMGDPDQFIENSGTIVSVNENLAQEDFREIEKQVNEQANNEKVPRSGVLPEIDHRLFEQANEINNDDLVIGDAIARSPTGSQIVPQDVAIPRNLFAVGIDIPDPNIESNDDNSIKI